MNLMKKKTKALNSLKRLIIWEKNYNFKKRLISEKIQIIIK